MVLLLFPAPPSSVVEAERPGRRSSLMRRVATSFYKGFWYSSAAIGCGLLGQGIATTAMNVNRTVENSEENIHVPLQMESGIPQGVAKALPLLRQAPPLPEASTVGVPITNNIVNNMQVPPPPEASAVGVPFTNNINIYGAGVDGNLSLLLIIFAILFLILVFIIVGGIVLTY
ncbi:unnamed protein product [Linum tenue]|uniref:Uncharacterized protein n=1 Tax=Linum tenue TaxID=586396 RepID=A0AAV0RKX4_9ROSI|nr:unnamed protein product [Linum tenue]